LRRRGSPAHTATAARTSAVDRELFTRIDNVWKWVQHLDGRSKAAATGFANLIEGVESLATKAGAEIGKLRALIREQTKRIDELTGELALLRAQAAASRSQPRRITRANTLEQDHAALN
jgi:TolA-binding protein